MKAKTSSTSNTLSLFDTPSDSQTIPLVATEKDFVLPFSRFELGGFLITIADVEEAQRTWGDGIVKISTAHSNGGDYVDIATQHVEQLYAYDLSEVLFKPTMASIDQFRPTFESALSYFVASNGVCEEDSGFAIKGWTAVRFENSGIIINESNAIAMGNYFFTGEDGADTKVEYTFGYIRDSSSNLRIVLHHSSLPASS